MEANKIKYNLSLVFSDVPEIAIQATTENTSDIRS